jgi:hypothetical protein
MFEQSCRCGCKPQDGTIEGVIIQTCRLAVKRDKIAT